MGWVDAETLQLGFRGLSQVFPYRARLNRARGRKSNCRMTFPPDHGECRRKGAQQRGRRAVGPALPVGTWAHISKSVHNSGPFRSRPQFIATIGCS